MSAPAQFPVPIEKEPRHPLKFENQYVRVFPSTRRSLRGDVVFIARRVVNVIECRHDNKFLAAELAFEHAEIPPWMGGSVFWSDSPKVVPFVPSGPGSAHNFEMQKIWRHDLPVAGE